MNPQTIEFTSPSTVAESCTTPWHTPSKVAYQDLILKPEVASRRYIFQPGATWFRIVPSLPTSKRAWMLGVHELKYQGGRHSHKKTLQPGGKSVFDVAYQWHKINRPEALFSNANKNGYKLLSDPFCIFWALFEEGGKILARIVHLSYYDGSRGGAAGLGHQILKLTQELDEHGNLAANPIDPTQGVQFCIEKTQPKSGGYANYTLRVGRVPAPMGALLARMEPSEFAALRPLEDVVHQPDEDEEWKLLEHVIDAETVAKIRDAQQ